MGAPTSAKPPHLAHRLHQLRPVPGRALAAALRRRTSRLAEAVQTAVGSLRDERPPVA